MAPDFCLAGREVMCRCCLVCPARRLSQWNPSSPLPPWSRWPRSATRPCCSPSCSPRGFVSRCRSSSAFLSPRSPTMASRPSSATQSPACSTGHGSATPWGWASSRWRRGRWYPIHSMTTTSPKRAASARSWPPPSPSSWSRSATRRRSPPSRWARSSAMCCWSPSALRRA